MPLTPTPVAFTPRDLALHDVVAALPTPAALSTAPGAPLYENRALVRLLATEPLASRVRATVAALVRAMALHDDDGGEAVEREAVGARVRYELRGAPIRDGRATRDAHAAAGAAGAAGTWGVATVVLVRAAAPRAPSDDELRARFALTAREVEVLHLLAEGRAAREVAAALGLSYFTARHHVEHVLGKLGVRSRAEVAGAIEPARDR